MELLVIIVIAVLVGTPIGVFIALFMHARLKRRVASLEDDLRVMEMRLRRMEKKPSEPAQARETAEIPVVPVGLDEPSTTTTVSAASPPILQSSKPVTIPAEPTPLPVAQLQIAAMERMARYSAAEPLTSKTAETAPPVIESPLAEEEPPSPRKLVDWEKFLGVKLFAWIGGLALFLGIAFFVKYSFDQNLIPPELRVALGFIAGLGLLIGGVVMRRKEYAVMAQTLCGTGIVVLYGASFAAHALYQLIGAIPVFALMSLVTATAFVLAVRMDAAAIAVLGLVGGFLTPPLLSSGQDNPFGLFSYILLLNVGLIAVMFQRKWNFLIVLGAVGTALMEIAWAAKFFVPEKVEIAMSILALFNTAYVLSAFIEARRSEPSAQLSIAVVFQALLTFAFAAVFISNPSLIGRPGVILGTIFLGDAALLLLVLARPELFKLHLVSGACAFLLLTMSRLEFAKTHFFWALGGTLLFAVLHSVYPLVLQRKKQLEENLGWANLFPLAALGLMLMLLFRLEAATILVWPIILLLDLLIVGMAFMTTSLLAALGAIILTAVFSAAWIFRIPVSGGGSTTVLIIGMFAAFFVAAGLWLIKKVVESEPGEESSSLSVCRKQLPAISAVLPFLLLALMILRFDTSNPSEIFGLAIILNILLLWLGRRLGMLELSAAALGASLFLQIFWRESDFVPPNASLALGWHLAFYALFTIYPFVYREELKDRALPWIVSALSGPLHFFVIYNAARHLLEGFPAMGLVPAVMALPPLVTIALIIKPLSISEEHRVRLLAWYAGSALFFVTMIFPIQFERHWLTIGWALEGVALVWLFRRLPHKGLLLAGTVLLVVAFVRLGLNLDVFGYYPRSDVRIFNWYLYSYGIVTVCLLSAGWMMVPPRHLVFGRSMHPLLYSLGVILAFMLLNIEIADFFSSGPRLEFEFSGNFARDMTYSIAWALFAFILLMAGISKEAPPARYASLVLLGATLLKLFFHDLTRLDKLYRIGALVGVAIILMLASWIYQRYLAAVNYKKGL